MQNGSYIDNLFSKVDTNSDGLIVPYRGETLKTDTAIGNCQFRQDDVSGIGQGWKSETFNSLLKILSTTAGSSGESTSLCT